METLLLTLALIAAGCGIVAYLQERARRRELARAWVAADERGQVERARLDARILELERQVDSMHSRGIPALPAPEEDEAPSELPREIREHLQALDDPEAIDEFAAVAELELSRGKPAEVVARELFVDTEVGR